MGAAAPVVAVFGSIVDQQQDARTRNRVDQQIQQRLGLTIYPVEILENDNERLVEALAQQHSFDRLQRPAALDVWIYLRQRIAGFDDAEQRVEIRQRVFECTI